MIHKLILTITLMIGLAHGAAFQHDDFVTTVETKPEVTKKIKQAVWNPPMGNIKSGESCEDGNCISDLNCFQKDGKMYKVVTSVRNEMKRLLKKL